MKTFGTLSLDRKKRQWVIECEPHVSIRLKRCFAKLAKNSHGSHRISDTVENAADLEWFLDRYPVVLNVADLQHLRARAAEFNERKDLVDGLLSNRVPLPPFDLAVPAREYQKTAAAMLLAGRSLLLADDVGLGKTASAICTFTDPRTLPALVVTLTHLPRQWEAEIRRFCPALRVHVIQQAAPYDVTVGPNGKACAGAHRFVADTLAQGGARCSRCAMSREDAYHFTGATRPAPDVLIVNYHKLSKWAEPLAGRVKSVVFDECQELRSGRGAKPARDIPAKYLAAEHIARAADFRLGLSATPIFNYGGEFFSVFSVLRPNELGEWGEFRDEWCRGGYDKPAIKDPKAFGAYAREGGLMLRRTRADVGRELPALSKVPHHVASDAEALDKVSASCAELARTILRQQGDGARGDAMRASAEFSNELRQATGIAKAPYVAEFVRLLVESGEKVVLFGWHRAVYDIWLDKLKDLNPALYTGSESAAAKAAARARFLETGPNGASILIMSLRAGAGLDGLQFACRTVVFGELDWSPAVHVQCLGRVHRDGQPDPVVGYFLIAEDGVDPIIADVLQVKKAQLEEAIDPDAELVEQLEVDPNHVRKLAAAYLAARGESIPATSEVA